jgi:glycosyltransferase involved in cell wall biosynthesis
MRQKLSGKREEVLEKGYTVVIVDDCSKDNSKKQLAGLPVYYLRHRVNMGQGAALQPGSICKKERRKVFCNL